MGSKQLIFYVALLPSPPWGHSLHEENQIAMDDLSINISGIAPAAARTLAAAKAASRDNARGGQARKLQKAQSAVKGKVKVQGKATHKEKLKRPKEAEERSYASKVKEWKSSRFKKEAPAMHESAVAANMKQDKKLEKQRKEVKKEKVKKKVKEAALLLPKKRKLASEDSIPKTANRKEGKSAQGAKERKTSEKLKEKLEGKGIVSEMKFKEVKSLNESLQRQLEYLNFTDCTPIQSLAVPRALTGKRDLMLRAPTGSGKTLAFLLPVIHQLLIVPGGLDRRTAPTRKAKREGLPLVCSVRTGMVWDGFRCVLLKHG